MKISEAGAPLNPPSVARFLKPFLVAPWSKFPNIAFSRTLGKSTIWLHSGRKYQIGIFGHRATRTCKKILEKLYVPLVQSCEAEDSPEENFRILPIWSYPGRKYRIRIFGQAAKMGKKSWRKTLLIIGATFRRKIFCSSQNFRILPIWECHPGISELCTSGA